MTHPEILLASHLVCQLLILLDRLGYGLRPLDNTMPTVTLNFPGRNISLPHCVNHMSPSATGSLSPTRILTLAFLKWPNHTHSVKTQPHWLSAFNNEVWTGTISPLCHTRTDPWGDLLVVMVLIWQSLPQRPGSIELH